jgi:hypothetical protein
MAMGRRYSIDGSRAVSNPTKTLLGLTSATTIRPFIYDLVLGASAAPADNAVTFFIQRYTAAGTATAVVPAALDPADPVATAGAGQNHTVEPTYTAGLILFHLALNQRASHRWIADPNGPMTLPATANNGAGLYPVNSSFTGTVDGTLHYAE